MLFNKTTLKQRVANYICNPFLGKVVRKIYGSELRRRNLKIDIASNEIRDKVVMMLFWNLYEKSEIILARKYITGKYPVVELGGSIGVVSSILGSQLGSQRLITVESDPNLTPLIEKNLQLNGVKNFQVIHGAISNEQHVYFTPGKLNTGGNISHRQSPETLEVPSLSLGDLIRNNSLEEFTLVSDIKGAESSFILERPDDLKKCKDMIIELHRCRGQNGSFYKVSDLKEKIKNLGFDILEDQGPVIYASRH